MYMETALTSFKAGDTIYLDVMLQGNTNYTQIKAAIGYNSELLEYVGYANLSGLVAEAKKDGTDKISLRSVATLNMAAGASCVTPVKVATLKFKVKDNLENNSETSDLSFVSLVVTPTVNFIEAKTTPGKPLPIILTR